MTLKDTVSAIRRQQVQLLRTVELLRGRCSADTHGPLAVELDAFERRLRQHVGLVDGVLDAMVEDDIAPRG